MAGGTFVNMNKKQPGFYLNMKSMFESGANVGNRGTVAIARSASWCAPGEFTTLYDPMKARDILGYPYTDDTMLWLRQIFRGSHRTPPPIKLLMYRLNTTGGAKAALSAAPLTATAKYEGERGNDIYLVVSPDVDSEYEDPANPGSFLYAVFYVQTVLDGSIVDSQRVGMYSSDTNYRAATVGDLQSNTWLDFSGTATDLLVPFVGAPLTGGADGTVVPSAYSDFLLALEQENFDVVIYDGTDFVTKQAIENFVKRLTYQFGQYRQAVMAKYNNADDPTIISNLNGMIIKVGEDDKGNPVTRTLTPEECTWWLGGCSAGASIFDSLTYAMHPDAIQAAPIIIQEERDKTIDDGYIIFIREFDQVKVMSDINTFHSLQPEKGYAFTKNKIIRMLWMFANDAYKQFSLNYIGVVNNDADGRMKFKSWIVDYSEQLIPRGITNFSADDVEVLVGPTVDSIIINLIWYVVDKVEKIYCTLTVSREGVAITTT